MRDQTESAYARKQSSLRRSARQPLLPQWRVFEDNAICAVVLQPPPLATSARFIEKHTGVDWLRVNVQAHTAIARFLEILDLVGRLLPIDNGDPPISFKRRAIQPFHSHWASGDGPISAAKSLLLLLLFGSHKSIIATA